MYFLSFMLIQSEPRSQRAGKHAAEQPREPLTKSQEAVILHTVVVHLTQSEKALSSGHPDNQPDHAILQQVPAAPIPPPNQNNAEIRPNPGLFGLYLGIGTAWKGAR